MIAGGATIIDLAAYLGVTPRRARQIIAEHGIEPVAVRWKAKLYPPRVFIRAARRGSGICTECKRRVGYSAPHRLRIHEDADGDWCWGSGRPGVYEWRAS